MKYPKFIEKGDTIAITASSAGIVDEYKIERLENAKKNLINLGYNVIETINVRTDENGRSSLAQERAKQFMTVWNNNNVREIICATGGDFACEMLDFLDFDELKNTEPKWLHGFSDITNLGYVFTTNLDIATVYCENIGDFGMKELPENLKNSINLLEGKEVIQKSFEAYEPKEEERERLGSYKLTKKSTWKSLNNEEKMNFSGRAIGGCFDIIINLIGTKYDKVTDYIEKYKDDGIVWFFDIYEMSTPQVFCHLWQMKNAGYFEYCNGIIFGRPFLLREDYDMDLKKVIKDSIGDLNIPVILDADIGHVSPQMPIINGSILDVIYDNGKGVIKTLLR